MTEETIEPKCPSEYTLNHHENGIACCYKSKVKKTRQGARCTPRNPAPTCPEKFILSKPQRNTEQKCVPAPDGHDKQEQSTGQTDQSNQTDPSNQPDQSDRLNETTPENPQVKTKKTRIKINLSKKNPSVASKKNPVFNELSSLVESRNINTLQNTFIDIFTKNAKTNPESPNFTDKEIKEFSEILSHEITYNYRKKDEIFNNALPKFLLNKEVETQKKNVFVLKNDNDFYKWLDEKIKLANYQKYITFPPSFINESLIETNSSSTEKWHVNTTGITLPLTWSRILAYDYRYTHNDHLNWINKIAPNQREGVKKLYSSLDQTREKDIFQKMCNLLNDSIFCVLYFPNFQNAEKSVNSNKDILVIFPESLQKNPKDFAKMKFRLFFFNTLNYNPVFLFENEYLIPQQYISHDFIQMAIPKKFRLFSQ